MSSKSSKAVDDVLKELKTLKKDLSTKNKSVEGRLDKIDELLHMILQTVNDLNIKKDIEINTSGVISTQKSSIQVSKKENIMSYFKRLYIEREEELYDIIPKAKMEQIFKEKEKELVGKKNLQKAKATALYKACVSCGGEEGKKNKNLLQAKQEQDREREDLKQREIVYHDLEEEKDGEIIETLVEPCESDIESEDPLPESEEEPESDDNEED